MGVPFVDIVKLEKSRAAATAGTTASASNQPPARPTVTLPLPPQVLQGPLAICPLPPQSRHMFSAEPGVPGGASSPGLMPGAAANGSGLLPEAVDAVADGPLGDMSKAAPGSSSPATDLFAELAGGLLAGPDIVMVALSVSRFESPQPKSAPRQCSLNFAALGRRTISPAAYSPRRPVGELLTKVPSGRSRFSSPAPCRLHA